MINSTSVKSIVLLNTPNQVFTALGYKHAYSDSLPTPKDSRLYMACVQMHRVVFANRPLFFGYRERLFAYLPKHPRIDSPYRWALYGWYQLYEDFLDTSETESVINAFTREGSLASSRYGIVLDKDPVTQKISSSDAAVFIGKLMYECGSTAPDDVFSDFHRGVDLLSLLNAGLWYGEL